jgi:hypothetical protein
LGKEKMNSFKIRALTLLLPFLFFGCGRTEHYAELHTSNGKIQVQLCDDSVVFSLDHLLGSSEHRLYQWTTLYGPGPIYTDPLLHESGLDPDRFAYTGTVAVDQKKEEVVIALQRVLSKPGEPLRTAPTPVNGTYHIKMTTASGWMPE